MTLAFVVWNSWNIFWYETILYGPGLFITILIPEVVKAVTASQLGATINDIVIWPLGGLTIYGPTDQGAYGDLKVALSGALAHIPIAGIFAVLYVIFKDDTMPGLNSMTVFMKHLEDDFQSIFATICRMIFGWNIFFFLIHTCVPIHPLGGIRVWAGFLRMNGISLTKTAKITSVAGMVLSIAIFVYGVILLFDRSIQGGVLEVLFGGFGFASSKALYDLVKAGRLTEHSIFGRNCYDESGTSQSGGDGNGDVAMTPSSDAVGGSSSNVDDSLPIENIESSEII